MNATVYTGRMTNWTSVVVSILLLAPLVGLGMTGPVDSTAVVVLLLIIVGVLAEVVTGSDVRVTAGARGVSIHWGLAGWPRASYALDEIVEASVADVTWWGVSWGLWWTPWRTVSTVRPGAALRLRLHSGRVVTVTVPDPAAAVAALRAA